MITKVVLAKLSPTMEEGTIVKWSKQEGDAIKVGDVLAEIETDKANMEMEALGTGVLRKDFVVDIFRADPHRDRLILESGHAGVIMREDPKLDALIKKIKIPVGSLHVNVLI